MTFLLTVNVIALAWTAGYWQGRSRGERPEVIVLDPPPVPVQHIVNVVHADGAVEVSHYGDPDPLVLTPSVRPS